MLSLGNLREYHSIQLFSDLADVTMLTEEKSSC